MALLSDKVHPFKDIHSNLRWLFASYPFILAVCIVIAYSNTFSAPFIFDDRNIIENSSIRNLFSLNKILAPTSETGIAGRPVINFTLALNYAVSGVNPWSYHLLNILIHLSSSLCLFGILRRTCQSNRLKERFGDVATPMAFACSLLWALHPLQTQAVTYTIQRCESLMGLCCLMIFYCAIRGWQSINMHRWHLMAVLSFVLGVGTKEVIVVAPFLLLLYDNIFFHTNCRDVLKKSSLLYTGLAIGLMCLGLLVGRGGTASSFRQINYSIYDYWITQPEVIFHYLRLVFWPAGLSIDYGWPIAKIKEAWPYLVIMIVLLIGSLLTLWKKQPLGFAAAWFFSVLAPTSVIPLSDIAFDHRMYLSSIAIIVIAVIVIYHFLDSLITKLIKNTKLRKLVFKRATFVFIIFSALALGITTYARNLDYSSEVSIWTDAVQKYPDNSRARGNLGIALLAGKDCVGAMHHLAEAIRIQPESANAHTALGISMIDCGKIDDAIIFFRNVLKKWPDYGPALRSLADALLHKGDYNESISFYKKALRIEPNNPEIYNNLGVALAKQGNIPFALYCFETALKINPSYTEAKNNLQHTAVSSEYIRSFKRQEK